MNKPVISFDDPPAEAPAVRRAPRVDREAAKAVARAHGFDRSVTTDELAPPPASAKRIDGRSLRRTGRTEQMNVKVSPEVRERYIALAQARGNISIGQLLEEGLALLEAAHRND